MSTLVDRAAKAMTQGRRLVAVGVLTAGTALLSACAVTQASKMAQTIGVLDTVALLPIVNHTDVAQAGLRAEALTEATLRLRGLRQLSLYPPQLNPETLFEPSERKAQLEAEKWARGQGIRYAVYGSVEEWRYKIGVDGEPAVGLTFHIKDLRSGEVVFSASGGRTGYSREALSAVAQKLTVQLLSSVQISAASGAPASLSPPSPSSTPPAAATPTPASSAPRSR